MEEDGKQKEEEHVRKKLNTGGQLPSRNLLVIPLPWTTLHLCTTVEICMAVVYTHRADCLLPRCGNSIEQGNARIPCIEACQSWPETNHAAYVAPIHASASKDAMSHTFSIPNTMLLALCTSKMHHRSENLQDNKTSDTKHVYRAPLAHKLRQQALQRQAQHRQTLHRQALHRQALHRQALHRQAVRALPSPKDPMHYHCYWYDATTLTQMNVYGSELLQIRCHLLVAAGLLAWSAYWHCYVETIGRACTASPMTTCTCPARLLTPETLNIVITSLLQAFKSIMGCRHSLIM